MLLIVFVHFNPHGYYDDYVDYYLNQLLAIKENKKLIFMSTSQLPKFAKKELIDKNISVVERENEGYDFYSYKLAIESVNIQDFSSVLICNDSVFGPFYELNSIYQEMQASPNDIMGFTQNLEHHFHLQSYFILFKAEVIHSTAFKNFWSNVGIISDRSLVIKEYELGLSKHFIDNGFKLSAYCNIKVTCWNLIFHSEKKFRMFRKCLKYFFKGRLSRVKEINTTHLLWKYMITEYHFPFIKRELIDKNPEKLNVSNIPNQVGKLTNYPTQLFTRKLRKP